MKRFSGGIGPILQHPITVIIITSALFHAVLWGMGISFNPVASIILLVLDAAIAYFLLDRLVYFFAQFVVPIQNPEDRYKIYKRVKVFENGRGPTLFVKNGRVIEHEGEADKRGEPGLIVVDTASAIVIQTDTEITGTFGPGITFIEEDEYIAGSADLRQHWQFIGPLMDEQPFFYPMPLTNQELYNDLESKRKQTEGLTRDAIEVSPTLSIKFNIKRPAKIVPSESGVTSHYGFDVDSVERAITHEVVNLEKNKSSMGWYKLPSHLVINIWREYIRKFKLDDIFTIDDVSGLKTIEDMINKRVTQEWVMVMNDNGDPTAEKMLSPEYQKLQEHGVQISEVRIHNVMIDPKKEKQIIERWKVEWMAVAEQEDKFLSEKERLIETTAREYASRNFAKIASSKFDTASKKNEDRYETLMKLIEPFKEAILDNSLSSEETEAQLKKLEEIWKWLLVNHYERESRMKQGKNG